MHPGQGRNQSGVGLGISLPPSPKPLHHCAAQAHHTAPLSLLAPQAAPCRVPHLPVILDIRGECATHGHVGAQVQRPQAAVR